MSPYSQAPHQPVTIFPQTPCCLDTLSHSHPVSLSTYLTHPISIYHTYTPSPSEPISLSPSLTLTLSHSYPSHCHPISLTPISLLPYLTHILSHPISLSPYLCVTLSPLCPGSDGGDAGAGVIAPRDGHRAEATPRPEGQPAGASEHAQTHPLCGNSLTCMHASSHFVTLVFLSFSSDL